MSQSVETEQQSTFRNREAKKRHAHRQACTKTNAELKPAGISALQGLVESDL